MSSQFGNGSQSPFNQASFENGLRMMEAQQQRAARSLINLIEMISTTSRRYAEDTTAFTEEAMSLMTDAATARDATQLADLQKKWAQTCMKYGQDQTRATMTFVEQCGLQALTVAAHATPNTNPTGAPPLKPAGKPKD